MSKAEEWVVNKCLRILAFLPVYTAIIVTLTLLAVIFGFPCVEGD